MEIISAFKELNYLAVTAAAIASFLLGWLWYSSVLFAGDWMHENRLSEEVLRNSNPWKTHVPGFVALWVMAAVLAILIGSGATLKSGVNLGALIGIGVTGASLALLAAYERKSLRHYLINAGYILLALMISGGIIGAWN